MKVLSLFSGIGAFERALENLEIPHELVAYCEIDKYASKAYSILHNVDESLNLHDVTTVDCSKLPKDIDLVTYGFPCQDISTAGKQRGLEHEGRTTRSGLVWEAHRIIKDTKPKVAICENVKNLTGKKFKAEFEAILENLDDIGYNNYYQVLNSKDYGIPQQRERVFIVSIRKDIDKGFFTFPNGFPLEKRLKDILDENVPDKYYLTDKQIQMIRNSSFTQERIRIQSKDFSGALLARDFYGPKCIKVVGNYSPSGHEASRVLDPTGIAPTIKENHGTVNALNICGEHYGTGNVVDKQPIKECVRKLTPTEYFKLMGFTVKDVELLRQHNISDTQLYKMAGNSIVVNVLMAIFKKLYRN